MRYGTPWWIGAGDPLEGLREAARHDFDLMELSLDAPWPEGLPTGALRDLARELDIALAFHGPWRDQSITHPRATLAGAAATVLEECVDVAIGLGAEYLVVHAEAGAFGRYPDQEMVQRGLEHGRSALAELQRRAGDDVELLVENTWPPLATPAQVASFLDGLDGVGLCFDPGHAALAVQRGVEGATDDPRAWTEALGDRLALVHAMDHTLVEGRVVDHLVPGVGTADLTTLVEATRTTGCDRVLIEAFYTDLDGTPAGPADVARGRSILEGLTTG